MNFELSMQNNTAGIEMWICCRDNFNLVSYSLRELDTVVRVIEEAHWDFGTGSRTIIASGSLVHASLERELCACCSVVQVLFWLVNHTTHLTSPRSMCEHFHCFTTLDLFTSDQTQQRR